MEHRAYEWIGTLGYPDIATLPFVRIYIGRSIGEGNGPSQAVPEYGFLLRDEDGRFEVFTLGLRTGTLEIDPGTRPGGRVGYERVGLDEYIERGLAELSRREREWEEWAHGKRQDPPDVAWIDSLYGEPFGHEMYRPPLLFRLFPLAYAAAKRGHRELAHGVWRLAAREIGKSEGADSNVLVAMKRQVAAEELRTLHRAFTDPERSFSEQLERFRRWRLRFKDVAEDVTYKGEKASTSIDILEQMVAEERQHGTQPRRRLEQMPVKERVAEFIRQLPGVTGSHDTSDWSKHVFSTPPGSAARQLAALGFDAAPQLVNALHDRSFSRFIEWHHPSKGFWRPSFRIPRVGDHARWILEVIFSREFRGYSPDAVRSLVEEIATQRATLVWIRQRPRGVFRRVRLLRDQKEIPKLLQRLRKNKGLVAVVAPGTYVVEGSAGELVRQVEVRAEATQVAEVLLDALSKADR